MKTYEAYILFKGNLSESALEQAVKDFEALLAKHKAKIEDQDKKGKTRLPQAIKKCKDAYQILFKVQADPASLAPIKKQLEIQDAILRSMFTNLVPIKVK